MPTFTATPEYLRWQIFWKALIEDMIERIINATMLANSKLKQTLTVRLNKQFDLKQFRFPPESVVNRPYKQQNASL